MNTLTTKILLLIVPALILINGSVAFSQTENKPATQEKSSEHVIIKPSDIKWTDGPDFLPPGAKMAMLEGDITKSGPFVVRVKLPAGYKIQPHALKSKHSVTVLSGNVMLAMGDKFETKNENTLPMGTFVIMPPKMNHFNWVNEEATIQVHGTGPLDVIYVNPQDDPRKATGKK